MNAPIAAARPIHPHRPAPPQTPVIAPARPLAFGGLGVVGLGLTLARHYSAF